MNKLQVKFCKYCGSALKMRYPGGDPENGPALPTCSKDDSHGSPSEDAYSMALSIANAICMSDKLEITSDSLSDDELYDAVINLAMKEIES